MNELSAKDLDAVATAFADGYEIGYVESKIILLNELLEKGILCEQTALAAKGIM